MPAICKCNKCGHTFSTRIIKDDPSINSFVTAADDEGCPECGSDDFEVTGQEYDDYD